MGAVIEYWILVALAAIAGWLGGYLSAYAKKKGENRAIHEDLSQLVEQMKAVTQATKEIENKISNDVWERQKRWEAKRDALFNVAKELGSMENAILSFHSAQTVANDSAITEAILEHKSDALTQWRQASAAFDLAHVQTRILCGMQVNQAIHDAHLALGASAKKL